MLPRLSAISALALVTAIPSAAMAERATLVATLSGSAEPGGGDPDGSGRAEITVDTARLRVCYVLTATGIAPASAANIYRGAADAEGRSVLRLVAPKDGESRTCVEVGSYEANELVRKPDSFYVSIRNDEHPKGALRGQLQK